MVHIIEDYCMTADSNCYTVGKRKTLKDGKTILVNTSYYSSAIAAIQSALDRAIMDKVAQNKITEINELVSAYKEITADVSNKLNGAFRAAQEKTAYSVTESYPVCCKKD